VALKVIGFEVVEWNFFQDMDMALNISRLKARNITNS
jgi:hypothetical protein